MNGLFQSHNPRSGNCLLSILLALAIAAIAGLAIELRAHDAAGEAARKAETAVPKSAEEEERERVEQLVFLENPEIAGDPKIDLSNRGVAVMEDQLALARRRLEAVRRSRANAETNFKRDKDSQHDLEDRLDTLDAELAASPGDGDLAEEIGELDLRLEETRAALAQAQADMALLRSYEKQMVRLVQDMETAIAKARRSGAAVVATADMDALAAHHSATMSAGTVVDDQRHNAMPAATGHVAGEEGRSAAARERAMKRQERRRAAQAGEEGERR